MDYDHWWERPRALLFGLVRLALAAGICFDVANGRESVWELAGALLVALYGCCWIVFAVRRARRRGVGPEAMVGPHDVQPEEK